MTQEEAFSLIQKALEATSPRLSKKVSYETHLTADGIVDSLDSMNFLFELEQLYGSRLEAIDESFEDFRVSRLVDILCAN
jgi:acyl carrier protein